MLIFSVSFQTLTETRIVQRIQSYRDVQDHSDARDSNAVDHNSRDTKDTRVSAGSRRINTVPPKTGVLVQTSQPRDNVRRTQTRRENEVPTKNREEQDQREILKSRDIRQVHNKRRVEVVCQDRDSVKEDVCSCHACPKTFPRFFDHSKEDTSMSFVFHTNDLTHILRKRLILQQGVERDRIC